jgi:hypothetical protein
VVRASQPDASRLSLTGDRVGVVDGRLDGLVDGAPVGEVDGAAEGEAIVDGVSAGCAPVPGRAHPARETAAKARIASVRAARLDVDEDM